jgi:hypothetical protein
MAPTPRSDNDDVYPVGWFMKFFVAYPSIIFAVSLVCASGLAAVALTAGAQEPYTAFSDFSAESVYQYYGFEVARMHWYMHLEDSSGYVWRFARVCRSLAFFFVVLWRYQEIRERRTRLRAPSHNPPPRASAVGGPSTTLSKRPTKTTAVSLLNQQIRNRAA